MNGMDTFEFFSNQQTIMWSMKESDKKLVLRIGATQSSIMTTLRAARPFSDRDRYVQYLNVRFRFAVRAQYAYDRSAVGWYLDGVQRLSDLGDIVDDHRDLRRNLPDGSIIPFIEPHRVELPAAFAWLVVAEAMHSFSPILLRDVQAIGLNGSCGARHLRGTPEEARLRWREFSKAVARVPPFNLDRSEFLFSLNTAAKWLRYLIDETRQ